MNTSRREVFTAAGSAVALSFLGSGCAPASKKPVAMQPVPSGRPDGADAGGTGLGLAIVETFAEAHGGKVTVESQEGEGSTFRFTVPPRAGA